MSTAGMNTFTAFVARSPALMAVTSVVCRADRHGRPREHRPFAAARASSRVPVVVPERLLRAAITGIALPDEAELRKLGRYRKLLEDSLQRRLAALEQLRKLTAERREAGADAEKSREFRVRLRVVA
jgi:hypothetical protein